MKALRFICPWYGFTLFFLPLGTPGAQEGKPPYFTKELSFREDTATALLLPASPYSESLRERLKLQEPSGLLELLYEMPLPDTAGQDLLLYIFQKAAAIRTMEGLKFYSDIPEERTLYIKETRIVEERKSYKGLPDLVFMEIPSTPFQATVFQRETTFGKIWYDVTLQASGTACLVSLRNSTTVWYKFFPGLPRGRLTIDMLTIPQKDKLLFYIAASYRLGFTFGIDIQLDETFSRRAGAIQSWFANQLYGSDLRED